MVLAKKQTQNSNPRPLSREERVSHTKRLIILRNNTKQPLGPNQYMFNLGTLSTRPHIWIT